MNDIQRYAEIKIQISRLEAELEGLKDTVFSEVMRHEGEKLETQFGEFKITQGVKKWTYSENLSQAEILMKQKIKNAKKIEELDGTALLESAPSRLVFTETKY